MTKNKNTVSPQFLKVLTKKLNEGLVLTEREKAYANKNELLCASQLNENKPKYSYLSDRVTGVKEFFIEGIKYYRIVAVQNFDASIYEYRFNKRMNSIEKRKVKGTGKIIAGTLGGYVDSDKALSQTGKCWIYDAARVSCGATVTGDAMLFDNAYLIGNVRVTDTSILGANTFIDATDAFDTIDGKRVNATVVIDGSSRLFGGVKIYGNVSLTSCNFCGNIRFDTTPHNILRDEAKTIKDDNDDLVYINKDKLEFYECPKKIDFYEAAHFKDQLMRDKIYDAKDLFDRDISLQGMVLRNNNVIPIEYRTSGDFQATFVKKQCCRDR